MVVTPSLGALQFQVPKAQCISDHADRAQRHRRRRDNRAQQQAEQRVKHARCDRHAGQIVVNLGQAQIVGGSGPRVLGGEPSMINYLDALNAFCRKWRVQELALFGSVLREDFSPESDVDVLVTFDQEAPWSLWDIIAMRGELEQILGRKVDLVEKDAIRNPFRRREILRTHQVVHAA